MKKMRRFLLIIIGIIIVIGGYFAWLHYQNLNSQVIEIEDVCEISVDVDDRIYISGQLDLDNFESYQFAYDIRQEDKLYIVLTKVTQLFPTVDTFSLDLDIQPPGVEFEELEQIILVGGQDMLVNYPDSPELNHVDVTKHDDARVIWEDSRE